MSAARVTFTMIFVCILCVLVASSCKRNLVSGRVVVIGKEKILKSGDKLILHNTTTGGNATTSSRLAVSLQEEHGFAPDVSHPIFYMRHGYDFAVGKQDSSSVEIFYPDSAEIDLGRLKQKGYTFEIRSKPSFQGFLQKSGH